MIDKIKLFIFVDALGWEVFQRHRHFLEGIAVDSKPLQTILGYSSACDPSIISGMMPSEHLHWSSFYYSPDTCPYRWVRHLKFIPHVLTDNHRIRHQLSRLIKHLHGFTGYFQIYNVPFNHLPLFDYAEKRRIWVKDGLLKGRSIFDELEERKQSYYVGDQDSEERQVAEVALKIKNRSISFAYLLLGKLDAHMHKYGPHCLDIADLLAEYERKIRWIYELALANYKDVELYVFSDHGMHEVTGSYNLVKDIEATGLRYGVDYVAFYDSTMARFWFLSENARQVITECLSKQQCGRILSDDDLRHFGVFFPDGRYGNLIFLMNSAILIVPSYMGLKPVKGMHGFHPDDPDSLAMILGNRTLPSALHSIKDIASLVKDE